MACILDATVRCLTTGVPARDFKDPVGCVPKLVPNARLSSSATKSSSAAEFWYRHGNALGGRRMDDRSKPDPVAALGGAFKLSANAEVAPWSTAGFLRAADSADVMTPDEVYSRLTYSHRHAAGVSAGCLQFA